MIRLAGNLYVPPELRSRVAALLPDHIAATRAEPGCLLFQVVPDRCDPGRYLVAERFVSRAAFDAHQARSSISDWGRATAGLERQYQIAEEPDDTAR